MILLFLACTQAPSAAESSPPGDSADTGLPDPGPSPAPLSSGACPDLASPGTSTFLSSGEERKVTVVWPDPLPADAPVVFFFHGLLDASGPNSPGKMTADQLGLDRVAEETGSIWVLPDAPVYDLLGYQFYLWDIALESDHDLVLFDDLRTCVLEQLGADPRRLSIMGFSGGALWTTVVLSHRGDTLAAAVEFSGGADVELPIFTELASAYITPAADFPVLLASGGETDVWPDPALVLVDFEAATDTLAAHLVADEHLVVRCHHDQGHTLTNLEWELGLDWALEHRYAEASPWAGGDLGEDADWCGIGG